MSAIDKMSYGEILARTLKDAPPARKGERTKMRLKVAAAQVLNRVGYRDIRVSDICEEAGIALASFYFHFENKTDITKEVLLGFLKELSEAPRRPLDGSIFGGMCAANAFVMRAFEPNAGLMRCLLQLGDEEPSFQRLWQQHSIDWIESASRKIAERSGEMNPDDPQLILANFIVSGMVDQLLRDLYINRHPRISGLVEQVAPTTDKLAEMVSLLWYRALFGRDPT